MSHGDEDKAALSSGIRLERTRAFEPATLIHHSVGGRRIGPARSA